ncbi:HsdM family class I SAM-dependent methyltransferase, partial [Escherichia sp. MOD1-EC6158]
PATSDQRPATSDQRPATSKSRKTVKSVEPQISDLANSWLKSYGLDYRLEQAPLNREIDNALDAYFSKNGGAGGNRPDVKLLIQDKYGRQYPVLIEYKGYKDRLIRLGSNGIIENKDSRKEWNFKNINGYAVNGAVHYANALLQFTNYSDIIAIGMTGWCDDDTGELHHEIGVWYVSKNNFGAGQKVGEYTDLSFLADKNVDGFINKIKLLNLPPEELEKIKASKEEEIDTRLSRLNNDIYQDEKRLGESDRVYLVVATVIATLGIPRKLTPLDKSELVSSMEEGERDGDIIFRKIRNFLRLKALPETKREMILRTLQNTLLTENINKPVNGESQLKRVFVKVVDDLGEYYKIGLTTDFTGKLFNEMYRWLGFTQDKLNDVVLTPPYVATLLAKLARVNKDSYVWDFATGSAGLLVAAMNEMLIDARENIHSPNELQLKEAKIKAEQLLGIEVLPSIYMLAILNMILMGDGSSNILNKDSLADFDGRYGFGKPGEKFPATAFVLNPPYSAKGNGMIFVQKALSMMKGGYAAVIIQGSAGSGKAKEYNQKILQENTLLASIKMPADLFIGKSSVQTYVYVFQVKLPHNSKHPVKFIDFSNDGYARSNRKKARNNLVDVDRARERYQEVVDLVHFGRSRLSIFTEDEYFEEVIDPLRGDDWNQTKPVDTRPTLADFKKTVADYLAWEVSKLLQGRDASEKKR